MRAFATSTSAHPTWGSSGRPILIGDHCEHGELGPCVVRSVSEFQASVKVAASQMLTTVQLGELYIVIDQVDHLVEAIETGI